MPLGDKDEENMTILLFFSLSPMTNCSCECDGKSNMFDKLLNTTVFIAAENGSVEELGLVALFLLKTGTFGAKNWQEISEDVISCFVEIFHSKIIKRRANTR